MWRHRGFSSAGPFVRSHLFSRPRISRFSTEAPANTRRPWSITLRVLKLGRTAFLAFAVYEAGYQSGVVEVSQDPAEHEHKLVHSIIKAKGATTILSEDSPEHQRVLRVSERLLSAARKLARERKAAAKDQHDTEHWAAVEKRLADQWKFFVIDSKSPNAFVPSVLPRRVFVHLGMLELCDTSDEQLALVIGHELSHLVRGHIEQSSKYNALLYGLELVLLSVLDPTGLFSVISMLTLQNMSTGMQASFSRDHENEADEMGLEIMSRACYNPSQGLEVFSKLAQANGNAESSASWRDSHPVSEDRKAHLQQTVPSVVHYFEGCAEAKRTLSTFNLFTQYIFGFFGKRVSAVEK